MITLFLAAKNSKIYPGKEFQIGIFIKPLWLSTQKNTSNIFYNFAPFNQC